MQGILKAGYLVARLNTLHATDGVVSNAPGPLNLTFRCEMEEKGKVKSNGVTCENIKRIYGLTSQNPGAYASRSLLPYSSGNLKSRIILSRA